MDRDLEKGTLLPDPHAGRIEFVRQIQDSKNHLASERSCLRRPSPRPAMTLRQAKGLC